MDLNLSGKVAVVTGASRGIGAAIALELARQGCELCLAARSAERLEEAADMITRETGRRPMTVAADLATPEGANVLAREVIATLGGLNILVNNAGATRRGHFLTLTEEDWEDGFALKFHGYVRLTRAVWPALKERGGVVVNIIGIGGRQPTADFTIGGSVNAALLNFTKALAQLGQKDGVRIHAINPGRIETDRLRANLETLAAETGMTVEEAGEAMQHDCGIVRFGRPEEIGWLAAFLVSSRAAFMQGSIVEIDGGQITTL